MTYPYDAALIAERNRARLYDVVIAALAAEGKAGRLSRDDLAQRLGKTRQEIDDTLSGPSDWTLDTVSDLLWAVGAELDVRVASGPATSPEPHVDPDDSWPDGQEIAD